MKKLFFILIALQILINLGQLTDSSNPQKAATAKTSKPTAVEQEAQIPKKQEETPIKTKTAKIKEPQPVAPATQDCHPSYSPCLNPNASDYDCRGGSGNGPFYTGTVQVIGPDVFGLDRDKDGWGCE